MLFEEDTDPKIRRNLVMASAAILLFAWLQVPLPIIADKVNPTAAPYQLSAWKLWLACLFVLTYLTLRYRFTKDFGEFGRSFRSTAWDYRNHQIDKLLQKSLNKFYKTGKEPPYFFKTLTPLFEKVTPEVQSHRGGKSLGRPLPVMHDKKIDVDQWKGTIQVSLTWTDGDKFEAGHSSSSVAFAVEGLRKVHITARSYIVTSIYSESSIHHIVPLVLCVIAYGTASWQLCRAW